MKKIFIPVLTLLILGFADLGYARWGETFSRHGSENDSLFSSDSDGYWLNKLRNYKKYPVNFYSQRLINKGSGEDTQEIEVHEYKRGVPVTARLGQRMYDSTTYTVTTKTGGEQYKAVKDGVIYNTLNDIKIKEGQIFTPLGEVKINGQFYVLFEIPEKSYVIAADYKGYFLDALGLVENGFLYVSKDITVIRPHDLRVEPYKDVKETSSDAELNFAVKYDGIEGDNMAFIISSSDNPDEDQRKFAPLKEKIIQIRGVNFEIIYAAPEYIEYVILDKNAFSEENKEEEREEVKQED
ncbi:MAG: hypothetical protein IJ532_04165 [Alphaproteobacteria bacterium]|nr:hypothetical protein [Alphaproteobacteria bacterium]